MQRDPSDVKRTKDDAGTKQYLSELRAVLGLDQPWPLHDVLAKLIEAAQHLLVDHNCDVLGHEMFGHAMRRGEEYLEVLHDASLALALRNAAGAATHEDNLSRETKVHKVFRHKDGALDTDRYREIAQRRALSLNEVDTLLREVEYLKLEWAAACPEGFQNIEQWERVCQELQELKKRR